MNDQPIVNEKQETNRLNIETKETKKVIPYGYGESRNKNLTHLPEPDISFNRITEHTGSQIKTNQDVLNPSRLTSKAQYTYPLMVLVLSSAYAKKVLDAELDKTEKYRGKNVLPEVTLFVMLEASNPDGTKKKNLVFWRKALIGINFINALSDLLIEYKFIVSKGKEVKLTGEILSKFLDYQEIGENIMKEESIIDFGMDKIQEQVEDYSEVMYLFNTPSTEPVPDISPIAPPVFIQDVMPISTESLYNDQEDVDTSISDEAVDTLHSLSSNMNSQDDSTSENKTLKTLGFGERGDDL